MHSAEPSAEDWRMDTKPPIAYVHTTVVPIMTQVYEIKRLTTLLTLPKDALLVFQRVERWNKVVGNGFYWIHLQFTPPRLDDLILSSIDTTFNDQEHLMKLISYSSYF